MSRQQASGSRKKRDAPPVLGSEPYWRHWRNPQAYAMRTDRVPHDDAMDVRLYAWHRIDPATGWTIEKVEQAVWRWEYLRRRPEYNEAWPALVEADVFSSGYFGLVLGLPDPMDDDPPLPMFVADVDAVGRFQKFELDLEQSLDRQLKQLRSDFKAARVAAGLKVAKGAPDQPYDSRLLRALDAKRDKPDISWAEIGEIVYGPADPEHFAHNGRQLYDRALEMQDKLAPLYVDEPKDHCVLRFGGYRIPVTAKRSAYLARSHVS